MKKISALVLGLALLGMASMSHAAATTSLTFPINVIVYAYAINIEGNSANAQAMSFGAVGVATTVYSNVKGTDDNEPVVNITNRGSATISLRVAQAGSTTNTSEAPVWTAASAGQAGQVMTADNAYRLSGLFTNYFGSEAAALASGLSSPADLVDYHTLVAGDFGTEDNLPTTLTDASATVFAITAQGADKKGYAIPPAQGGDQDYLGQRALRFALDTPTITSDGLSVQQIMNVTVSAY